MKKSLLALAALTAFAGAASAQSSVTLFGIMDLSLRNVDNGSGGKLRTLSTDGQASSRLGFRGIEDLGGGLRAAFWLEGALAPDVGGGGKVTANGNTADPMVWTRRATVGLIGGFGEVRLGRDYTPTFSNMVTHDPFGYVGVATLANVRGLSSSLGSGAGTAVRANNTVSYFLPALGGVYGQVQYALAENAPGNGYFGARVGYAAGPLNVAAAYGKTLHGFGVATPPAVPPMADNLTNINLLAQFDLGFVKLSGVFEKSDYRQESSKLYGLSGIVPIGAGNLKLAYVKTTGSTDKGPLGISASDSRYGASQYSLGYVYNLSKRSSLYAQVGRINNAGKANFSGNVTATTPAVAGFGNNSVSSNGGLAGIRGGEKSTGTEIGIRHDF
jgi:predicted porin